MTSLATEKVGKLSSLRVLKLDYEGNKNIKVFSKLLVLVTQSFFMIITLMAERNFTKYFPT